MRRRSRAAQDRLADASAYAAEAVGAVRTMQAFGMEGFTAARFARAAEEAFEAARASITMRAWLTGTAIFLISASVVGVLWYGAQDVLAGAMTAGRLSQFVLYAVFAASSLGQLSEVYGELAQAAGAAERLGEILAAKPAVKAPPQPEGPAASRRSGPWRSRTSRSPIRPATERAALHGLSFAVAPASGSRSSGLRGRARARCFQLLLRFYDPQAGTVLVDGIADTGGRSDRAAARAWPSCRRSRRSSRRPSSTTSATAGRRPRTRRCGARPASPRRTASSAPCRRATTR